MAKAMKPARARVARKPVKSRAAAPKAAQRSSVRPVKGNKVRSLSKRELEEFRKMLEEERERLTEELEAMEEHAPEVEEQVGMDIGGGYDEDLADVASSTFEREKGLALESSVQAMLAQVEEALSRIDDGSYGVCQRCGDAIDAARLRVLPYATLCIRCKELEEKSSVR